MRLERRAQTSRRALLLAPVGAVLLTLALTSLLVAWAGAPIARAYLLLIEAVKNAKPMLHWLAPLVVYHENGSETEELKSIYSGPSGLRGRQYGTGCDPTTGSEKSDG